MRNSVLRLRDTRACPGKLICPGRTDIRMYMQIVRSNRSNAESDFVRAEVLGQIERVCSDIDASEQIN